MGTQIHGTFSNLVPFVSTLGVLLGRIDCQYKKKATASSQNAGSESLQEHAYSVLGGVAELNVTGTKIEYTHW